MKRVDGILELERYELFEAITEYIKLHDGVFSDLTRELSSEEMFKAVEEYEKKYGEITYVGKLS